ncbi:hypothetical protein C8R47DRAFT_1157054 [Mycena vitilis]|nr:hypothetical protein C8R47DRAFT_1157054 [Mycena vitilis]
MSIRSKQRQYVTAICRHGHMSAPTTITKPGSAELAKSLTAHFGKFGTVKSVDGLGKLDGVGLPRKFGFVSIEGSEASIAKCVNSLSGSIWKGVKVRVGDARPDVDQRPNSEEPPPPRRKRKRGGVQAEDMTLVTPETAAQRSGWKVSEMGRVMRPVRIRPEHPLPPPLISSVPKKPKSSSAKESAKPKKKRDPDSRARQRTIDMTRWGSVHLTGIFLEDAGQATGNLSQDEVEGMVEADLSDSSVDSEPDGGNFPPAAPLVEIEKPTSAAKPASTVAVPAPTAASKPSRFDSNQTVISELSTKSDIDLAVEKTQSLSLLNSLFGARDGDWVGRESVGSDVDEEELLKVGGTMTLNDDDAIEFVPMDVDVREPTTIAPPSPTLSEAAPAPVPPPKRPTQATKLKDLFVSRDDDVGFSLLGHLDLDLELDEEMPHAPSAAPQHVSEAAPQLSTTFVTPSQAHITLDPKQPLFFPLPTSFTPGFSSTKARQRDILDVGKDNGWNAHFCRNETDDEIRAKWEKEKVDLTREWNRRWREAGKVRRRRGGGDGD